MSIENNVVDDVGTEEAIDTHEGECYGLGSLATSATVTMKGNEIRNIGRKANGTSSNVILAGGMLLIDNSFLVSPELPRNGELAFVFRWAGVSMRAPA